MKLEVGKKYKRRDGKIVTVVGYTGDKIYPYKTCEEVFYKDYGQYWHSETVDFRDLVEEVKPYYTVAELEDMLKEAKEREHKELRTITHKGWVNVYTYGVGHLKRSKKEALRLAAIDSTQYINTVEVEITATEELKDV